MRRAILALISASWWVAISCADEKVVDLLTPTSDVDPPDVTSSESDAAASQDGGGAVGQDEGEAAAGSDAGAALASAALYFGDGADASVEVANTPMLNLASEFTMEAWIYFLTLNGGELVLNQWVNGQEDKFIGIDATSHFLKAWFFMDPDAAAWSNLNSTVVPSLMTWHHLAASAGGGVVQLFLDGQSIASTPLPFPVANSTGTFFIGASNRDGWHAAIDGYIAEVRISSVNRYPSNFSPSATLSVDADTLGYWPLYEGSGRVAHDLGPSHLDGALAGPVTWVPAPAP